MEYKKTSLGLIPEHWKVVSIEEIGEVIGGGTPSTKISGYYGGDIPWITPKDLSGYTNKYISSGSRNITQLGLENSSARLLPKQTVLLSSRAPIGYVAIADNELTTNQGFKSIICNEEKMIPEFLYYILLTSKERLESISSGSTFKEVSGKIVKSFKIQLPPLNEQKEICSILSNIDSKIELNNQLVLMLEETASTLFKHWFVDFEFPDEKGNPYKTSGGKMNESELGEIPEGWEIKKYGDLFKFIKGRKPNKLNEKKGNSVLPYLTINYLKTGKEIYVDINEKVIIADYFDSLMVMDGASSGKIFNAYNGVVGSTLSIIRAKEDNIESFLYFALKSHESNFTTHLTGSAIPHTDKEYVYQTEISLPKNAGNRKEIEQTFRNFRKLMYQKNNENKISKILRDMLLPKLLSGEIELPIEKEV